MEVPQQCINEGRKTLEDSRKQDLWSILVMEILSGAPQKWDNAPERCRKEILKVPPAQLNEEIAVSILKKNGYRFPNKGRILAEVAEIYAENKEDKSKLIGRLAYKVGRKSFDLILEDLGDDEAVAVDRHLARFFNLKIDEKTGAVNRETYEEAQRKVKELAREKNEKPAVIERAIWLYMSKR